MHVSMKEVSRIQTLFFNFFKLQNNSNYPNGYSFNSLRQYIWYFEPYYNNMKDFDDCFFHVAHPNYKVHEKMCHVESSPSSACTEISISIGPKAITLKGVESYVYKEDDLSLEELYLKNQLVTFYQELGHVGVLETYGSFLCSNMAVFLCFLLCNFVPWVGVV